MPGQAKPKQEKSDKSSPDRYMKQKKKDHIPLPFCPQKEVKKALISIALSSAQLSSCYRGYVRRKNMNQKNKVFSNESFSNININACDELCIKLAAGFPIPIPLGTKKIGALNCQERAF
jgi:hypothetical protein